MASTNKTTNYELSQFLGTDKPAWLTDYNSDMSKIDAGVHTAQTTATGADGKADANATAIGTLANLTTTAKTNLVSAINEVDSNADTAQETANDAVGKANTNTLAIANITKELNWNTFNNLTFSGNVTPSTQNVKIAMNENKSQFKVYGQIAFYSGVAGGSGVVTLTSGDTGLRPSEAITIMGTTIKRRDINNAIGELDPYEYTLNTDGTITVSWTRSSSTTYFAINFIACITILEQFGD